MAMPSTPLLLRPILLPKVWGGRRLARLGKPLPANEAIGESWEVADLPWLDPPCSSVVAAGPFAGSTLRALIEEDAEAILGRNGGDRFPLLVKYLDAATPLSVQVHPSPAFAAAHPAAHLKSEAWYIVAAEPGSRLWAGLVPGIDRAALARLVAEGRAAEALRAHEVAAGDCLYLPSGTCHALGGGILVAEVQTPSDTTFRLDDWGRTDRPLHVAEALACIDDDAPAPEPTRGGRCIEAGPFRTTPLLRTEHFAIERVETRDDAELPIETDGRPEVWMILEGGGRLPGAPPVEVRRGDTVVMPAALRGASAALSKATTLLRISTPGPVDGALA